MEDVITRYMDDVKTRSYPPAETINMPEDELRKFAKDMKWERKLDELVNRLKLCQLYPSTLEHKCVDGDKLHCSKHTR